MALEDYMSVMERCSGCSYCKWIPFAQVKSSRFAKGCPSIEYNKFQSYSSYGRLAVGLSLLQGRSTYTDRVLDIVNSCLLCGSCDVSCKVCRYNMEPLETFHELRFKLVEDGQILPQHLAIIRGLRKEDNMLMKPRSERGRWADGLKIRNINNERADVLYHVGCRSSYDEDLWKIPRIIVSLLGKAGVNFGIMGKDESCCGGQAYHMGYRTEFLKFSENNLEAWKKAGVKTVVTSCSDCYYTFKRLYPLIGSTFKVLHVVEFLEQLISEGKLKLTKTVPIKITYHDPCHLGRQGEPFIPWKGKEKKILGQVVAYEPRKPRYNGASGIYMPPRNILKSIPGVELTEMERIKEYAWCCGAGGGVKGAYPDFSQWTAEERIAEARATEAEAIVTACPWCERNFSDAINSKKIDMKVYDVVELVHYAI